MKRYQYSPLSKAPDSIRLLRLLPSELDEAEIRAELLEYSLQTSQRSRHSYEALSYVWGGLNTTRSIFIGEDEIEITPNLHAALLRFRDFDFPRILWIDAVCINQSDEAEKELQIRNMAMIYGYAKCIIVWLGEESESSELALEVIRTAGRKPQYASDRANDRIENVHRGSTNVEQAITSLLQREWFQRIWVLQEVAAARHVVVVCGPVEIDGYAFCMGLEQSRSSGQHTQRYAQIRPVINLIRGAIFRPRFTQSDLNENALNISSLGELMSMYHNLNATHRHDKIFALIGMASDDVSKANLLPDYSVPWDELFRRFMRFLFGAKINIKTWADKERAEISGLGGIIGSVYHVFRDMDGKQKLHVRFNNSLEQYEHYQESYGEWTLEVTVNDVRSGDMIYLLEEAPKPMIVRRNKLLFDVVVLAVRPPVSLYSGMFPRNLRLTWDWLELAPQSKERSLDESIEVESSWTVALIFKDSAEDDLALEMISWLIQAECAQFKQKQMDNLTKTSIAKSPSQSEAITEAELIEVVQRFGKDIVVEMLKHKGQHLSITEAVLVSTIQHQDDEVVAWMLKSQLSDIKVTPKVVAAAARRLTQTGFMVLRIILDGPSKSSLLTANSFKVAAENTHAGSIEMMDILLDFAGTKVESFVTESVLTAAASNPYFHAEMLQVFLSHQTIAAKVTQNVVKAVLSNRYCTGSTIKLLLEYMPDRLSDEIVIEAFRSSPCNNDVLICLLDHRTQNRTTSEALWTAAAQNTVQATTSTGVLIEDHILRQTRIYINEAVLIAAASNQIFGAALMRFLMINGWISDFKKTEVMFPDEVATPRILVAAARNENEAADIMRMLVKGEQGHIHVSDELIAAATSNGQWELDLLLLLKECSTEACQARVRKALNAFFW